MEGTILLFLVSDGERLLVPAQEDDHALEDWRRNYVIGPLPPTNLERREAVDDPTVWLAPAGRGLSRPLRA